MRMQSRRRLCSCVQIVRRFCCIRWDQNCLNKNVFKRCLKTTRLRDWSRRSSGRLFQRVGPVEAKPRGPNVLVFVRGTRRSPRAVERSRRRDGMSDFNSSISARYGGAMPCRHLYTSRPSLKLILWWMGSQWRRSRMSTDIGSNLRLRRTRRAATRTTDCSWLISPSPIPASRLLQ